MESEPTADCANPTSLLDPPKRKRARRDPGSEFDKNIVVLNSSDVLEDQEGAFLALNTMERAQLRRDKQRFKKVCFTQLMTEWEVQKKLEDPAVGVALLRKKRYKFASADGYGHLNYHGKERWNGSEIKSWLPGTSALYILLQDSNQDDRSKEKMETKEISTSQTSTGLCKDSSLQSGSMPSSPESPSPSPSLSSSCLISYPSASSSSLSSMTLMVKADKSAASIKKEYSDLNEHYGASFQPSKKIHSPQTVLSWSSSSSSSLPLPKSSLISVGVSGTWYPPGPKPWNVLSSSCKCSSQTSTDVTSSDTQNLKESFECHVSPDPSAVSTVAKQEAQISMAMSSGCEEASSHSRSGYFISVFPKTTETKSDESTCSSVRTEQDIYPDVSSHASASSTDEIKPLEDYKVSSVSKIQYTSSEKSPEIPIKQAVDGPGNLLQKDSDSETSDERVSITVREQTSSLLTSGESSVLRGSVQCIKELPTRLVKMPPTGTSQVLPSVPVTCGETSNCPQTQDIVRNNFQGESEAKSGHISQSWTQENVVADLTSQATLVFQQVFAQSLVTSVGPLSKLLSRKSQKDKMVQCVGLDQASTVAESCTSASPIFHMRSSSSSVDQSDIVEEIWPKEGPCKGGGAFLILLKQNLRTVSAGQSITVIFKPGGVTCAYLNNQHKDRLHGNSIPAARTSGMSSVIVVTEEGRVLGETTFTYIDNRSEVNRLLNEAFNWTCDDPQSPEEDRQDSSDSYEDITARLASVMDAIENAARKGDKPYFQKMFANQRGRYSYKLCLSRRLDPENIARENGQTELATYLAACWRRASTQEERQTCEKRETDSLHSGPQEQVSDPLGMLCEVASSRKPISQSADTDHSDEGLTCSGDGNEAIEQETDTEKPEHAAFSQDNAGSNCTINILGQASSSKTSSLDDCRRGAQWDENFAKKAMILPFDFATNPLTAMELAKVRKDRSDYGKVPFSKRMDENIVRETLKTMFCKLQDKRFSLAVMDHGRLSFHESECWNGRNVHKWCKNDKVLYIIPQEDSPVVRETTSKTGLLHDNTKPPASTNLSDKNDDEVPDEENPITEDSHAEVQDAVLLEEKQPDKVQEYH